jgi:hypothetical protein
MRFRGNDELESTTRRTNSMNEPITLEIFTDYV